MKLRIKRFAATSAALLLALCVLAQPTATVQWSDSTAAVGDGVYEITFTGRILDGWHTYDLHSGFSSTVIAFEPSEGVELMGDPFEKVAAERRFDEIFGEEIGEYEGEIVLGQRVRLTAAEGVLRGNINWRSCQGDNCNMPEDWPFEIRLPAGSAGQDTAGDALHQSPLGDAADPAGEGLLGLILVAIGWGLLALLTPCVFPMIPMTVSFFLKGSESTSAGRFKASMYGLFIVLLYTVPIAAIILLTRLLGGDAVTADIFNWLATHWLPNLIFFIVFMVFAASFFGAFEITLPGWMVNKSDRNADRGGLLGVFFMALTLVLVSFSCTGPIVGSAIIGATAGDFWAPILTMLVFSITFALPFTLFAMFPSLLKNLPKSGGWLNSVKVVLGFIEVALGFKFLSVADQTYHWGLLDREVYLKNGNKFPEGYELKGPAVSSYSLDALSYGNAIWEDVNGDGLITTDDKTIIGDAYPDFTGGFSTNLSWKGLDFSASFVYSYGGEVINFQDYYLYNMEGSGNQYAIVADRYISDEQPGRNNVPIASRISTPNTSLKLSSYYVEDASFFRCANITLGYTLPKRWMSKLHVSSCRVYFSGDNLFTITPYRGYNPEVSYKSSNLMPGFDWGCYPLARIYSLGLNLTF